MSNVDLVSIGKNATNSLVSQIESINDDGIAFTINEKERFELPILGEHNMKNASIAIAVGKRMNLSYDTILIIYEVQLTGMRMQQYHTSDTC